MFQLQRRKGLEENTPTSSTDYRPETPKTSRRLPPQGDGVSKRHKMDETDRPGRTLDKDVDENPTENPSAEYHQNACRRVSVDDNVHVQSIEIKDETTEPLEETPNAEQTVNIISSDDDDFKLSKKTSRRKRAKK